MKQKILWAVAICLCLLACVNVYLACTGALSVEPLGSWDFQYDSAWYLKEGINPYEETLHPTSLQDQYGLEKYYEKLEANQFPSLLMILIPFTFFDPPTANLLFLIFNCLCSIGILYFIKKLFVPKETPSVVWLIFVALFFAGSPWYSGINNGQHTLFSIFFFLLSLWLTSNGKHILSGLALSISFFKYALTVPMAIYLIYKRQFKELIIAVGIHVILTIVAALWLKAPLLDMILLPLEVSSNLATQGTFDIGAIFHLGSLTMPIAVALLAVVCVLAFFKKIPGSSYEVLSLLTMFGLIVIYHRIYDFFVLIIPLIVFCLHKREGKLWIASKLMISFSVLYTFILMRFIPRLVAIATSGLGSFVKSSNDLGVPSLTYMNNINVAFALFFYATIVVTAIALHRQCKSEKQ